MTSGPPAGRPAEFLTRYLDAPLRAAGFDLEDVSVRRAGRSSVVAVTVDRDGTLDLDAIAEASRIVSDSLDAHEGNLPGGLNEAYTLEVTSRGTDAPLVLPRHWRRAVGRLVDVRLRDGVSGSPVVGRVSAAADAQAVLTSVPKPHKPGARVSAKPPAEVIVRYEDVLRAVVQLEFTSPDGSDDFDDEISGDEISGDEIETDGFDDVEDAAFGDDDDASDGGTNR